MLNNATVTMPYKDLQEILDKNKEYEEAFKKIKSIQTMKEEEFEKDPFVKGLDKINKLLEEANKVPKACEKQYYIYQCLAVYCDTFGISKAEYLEDVSMGDLSTAKSK